MKLLVCFGGWQVWGESSGYWLILTCVTEDNILPGFRFKIPMMIVLDTLKNENSPLRRVSETWMRCSLKSYIRCVLEGKAFSLTNIL